MSKITDKELENLSIMYEGDKKRDAADKVRGFLFQDYVAVMCLLQDKVEYVCLEYLEDVDVFYEDGRFEFIQVKYYPKTNPNMNEISTDLYYQFLRLQMLHSNLIPKPCLFIHRVQAVEKPAFDQMKSFVGLEKNLPTPVLYPSVEESTIWLKKNVYINKKKSEQKKSLFTAMASEKSLNEFLESYKIYKKPNIDKYKEELLEALAKAYLSPETNENREQDKLILLGLAIVYVQKRYALESPDFAHLRVCKQEFNQYMTNSVKTKNEQTIVSYLIGVICEQHDEIVARNSISELQNYMLDLIFQNTVQWINEIGKKIEGQYQLLNTFSLDEVATICNYKRLTVEERLIKVAESKQGFCVFLSYLWKIMLNICQDKVQNYSEIMNNLKLFDPQEYIVSSVTDYICMNFPDDKFVNRSVILPQAGPQFNGSKRKIVERMVNTRVRPGKWFFQNNKIIRGKNYYKYSTANVSENPTVADLGEDSFYIECMDCIGIDEGEWKIKEDCGNCIFSESCIGESR